MTCGGSHLGFRTGIKNPNFLEDLQMIIPGQFVSIVQVVSEKKPFFSETTNMIKAKLYMNVHWMVLYKLQAFCSDMKFKMVATAA
jgi:hypothetical protein